MIIVDEKFSRLSLLREPTFWNYFLLALYISIALVRLITAVTRLITILHVFQKKITSKSA